MILNVTSRPRADRMPRAVPAANVRRSGTEPQRLGAGLDMDVRRFLLYRVGDDLVDEADERRIIGDVA
jgi:hypothetical protein